MLKLDKCKSLLNNKNIYNAALRTISSFKTHESTLNTNTNCLTDRNILPYLSQNQVTLNFTM